MKRHNYFSARFGMLVCLIAAIAIAQDVTNAQTQASGSTGSAAVAAPRLVKFGGVLKDGSGLLRSGVMGLTFAIYKEQQGGNPLWLETQNVQLDAQGNYSVLLGATQSEGLPLELFTTDETRWLGVQAQLSGEVEQPRVLLTSVPYALKAADAETLGGLPVSAFLLANPDISTGGGSGIPAQAVSPNASGRSIFFHTADANTGGTGTANKMTKWLNNTGTLTDSAVFESGGNVGIGTSTPASQLDIENFGAANDATKEIMRFGGGTDPTLGPMVLAFEAHPSATGGNRFFALDTGDNLAARNLILLPTGGANIGIGTTTPKQALEVNGNVQVDGKLGIGTSTPASQLDIENSGAANDATKEIMRFGGGTDPTLGPMVLAFEAHPSATGSNRFFALDTGDNAAVRNLILLPSGGANVGIGTTTPAQRLEVNGTAKVGTLMFADSTTMTSAAASLSGANTFTGADSFTAVPTGAGVGQGSLYINPASAIAGRTLLGVAVNGTSEFLVDSGGNTTANGNINTNGNINLNGSTNGNINLNNISTSTTGGITLGFVPFIHAFGSNNTFVGQVAGNFSMTGSFNTGIGGGALNNNTSGLGNTAVGQSALISNTSASNNTAIGQATLQTNTTGANNTASGFNALLNNTTGGNNTASGANALFNNTTASNNTASGVNALTANTTGNNNTASGVNALFSNTTGVSNTASGVNALKANTSGNNNTASGLNALAANNTANNNTASGQAALFANTTGTNNTASGQAALTANTTGANNTASGVNALKANTTATNNTASGFNALQNNTTGSNNIADGNNAGVTTTSANANTTGSNNTFIGASSGPGVPSASNLQNATAIGANAVVSANNALVLGSINTVNGATSSVNVGIGTATPGQALDVVGNINASGCFMVGGTGFQGTCSSDARLKKNILYFPQVLDKLVQLQPAYWNWRAEEFPQYHFGPGRNIGLIAQEVEKVFPDMVSTDTNGYKQVNYSQLPYLMLQAIRELKSENDTLRDQLQARERQQQAKEAEWEERLQRLESAISSQPSLAMR